mgnify:CR=1 FL=1
MEKQIKKFVESFQKPMLVLTIKDFIQSGQIKSEEVVKSQNHEIWQKCECVGEEDLKKTWNCSDCGAVLFTPSNN